MFYYCPNQVLCVASHHKWLAKICLKIWDFSSDKSIILPVDYNCKNQMRRGNLMIIVCFLWKPSVDSDTEWIMTQDTWISWQLILDRLDCRRHRLSGWWWRSSSSGCTWVCGPGKWKLGSFAKIFLYPIHTQYSPQVQIQTYFGQCVFYVYGRSPLI